MDILSIPPIYLAAFACLLGFIGLVWSADKFVEGSAAIAHSFGLSPMIIGLTIVSFGTSAPEVMVSISSALKNAGELAIGNAVGSNIANMALVLGVTALIIRIPVQAHLKNVELPLLLLISLLAGYFLFDNQLTLTESTILLGSLLPIMVFLVIVKQKGLTPTEVAEEEKNIPDMGRGAGIMWFTLGLAALMLSSEILVWGAKSTATHFGISPFLIGLTVVALGTSLPELAASVTSALKGHHDIALGNIIGSNMFNLQAVMAIPALIQGSVSVDNVFERDYTLMFALTVFIGAAVFISLKRQGTQAGIGKVIGAILLTAYLAYYIVLFS